MDLSITMCSGWVTYGSVVVCFSPLKTFCIKYLSKKKSFLLNSLSRYRLFWFGSHSERKLFGKEKPSAKSRKALMGRVWWCWKPTVKQHSQQQKPPWISEHWCRLSGCVCPCISANNGFSPLLLSEYKDENTKWKHLYFIVYWVFLPTYNYLGLLRWAQMIAWDYFKVVIF